MFISFVDIKTSYQCIQVMKFDKSSLCGFKCNSEVIALLPVTKHSLIPSFCTYIRICMLSSILVDSLIHLIMSQGQNRFEID